VARRLKNTLLEAALHGIRDGVIVADARAKDMPIVYVNPAFEQMTGYAEAELLGRNCRFLQGEDRRQRAVSEMREAIAEGRGCEVLLRNYRKDGSLFWNQLRLQPFEEKGRINWWIGTATDVGALHDLKDKLRNRQRALAEARASAPDDRLTGLRSRVFFDETLEREWSLCQRESRSLDLFLYAIDHVEPYLDTFGRRATDVCLRQVARGIHGAFRRSSDVCARFDDWRIACFASRMDGGPVDEFAAGVCERVKALCIHHPHSPISRFITVSSAAVSLSPDASMSLTAVLASLEESLEQAVIDGGDRAIVDAGGS